MITKTLKTIKGKLLVKIPDKLNEITIDQMMALQSSQQLTDIEAISILSGISIDELKNVSDMDDFAVFEQCISSLSHQIKHLYNSDDVPKNITFFEGKNAKRVNVTGNLSVEPVGAFMAAREIINEEINDCIKQHGEEAWKDYFNPSLKACCQVLAHYFFCRVTGKKYNEYEAEEFCNEIKRLRVTEALPIAKHFFTCYPNLSKRKTNFFHRNLRFWKSGPVSNLSRSLNISTL